MPATYKNSGPNRYPLDGFQKQRMLDWLCTIPADRTPGTMRELAEELAVGYNTIQGWKKEPAFIAAWEQRYRQVVGSPEKAQEVIERLHETAVDRTDPRQVPAAKAYLEAIDAIKPKKIDVTVTKAAKDLSDDELLTLLAESAAREIENRADA